MEGGGGILFSHCPSIHQFVSNTNFLNIFINNIILEILFCINVDIYEMLLLQKNKCQGSILL